MRAVEDEAFIASRCQAGAGHAVCAGITSRGVPTVKDLDDAPSFVDPVAARPHDPVAGQLADVVLDGRAAHPERVGRSVGAPVANVVPHDPPEQHAGPGRQAMVEQRVHG